MPLRQVLAPSLFSNLGQGQARLLGAYSTDTPTRSSLVSTRAPEWSTSLVRACPQIESGCSWAAWRILLPEGPFDLVVSCLAVHHLVGPSKADLFRRIARKLAAGGRFVLADVVEPVDPSYVVTEIDPEVDHPSKLDEQLAWLEAARLFPEVTWTHRDLVVIVASPR